MPLTRSSCSNSQYSLSNSSPSLINSLSHQTFLFPPLAKSYLLENTQLWAHYLPEGFSAPAARPVCPKTHSSRGVGLLQMWPKATPPGMSPVWTLAGPESHKLAEGAEMTGAQLLRGPHPPCPLPGTWLGKLRTPV